MTFVTKFNPNFHYFVCSKCQWQGEQILDHARTAHNSVQPGLKCLVCPDKPIFFSVQAYSEHLKVSSHVWQNVQVIF